MTERVWSPQQESVFAWAREGKGNLIVRARAGTGKTTTIIEMIERAPEENILLCAFNKRIAEELSARLKNPRAGARTLHSVGFGLVRKYWKVQVDVDRGRRLAAQAWASANGGSAEHAPDAPTAWIAKLAGLIKNVCVNNVEPNEVIDLAYSFDIVPQGEWQRDLTVENLAELAIDTCVLAQERDGTIDYDDMVWLPVVHEWLRPTYDLVVVDEAQDMNTVQLALAMGAASGRIAVVGDDRQAIYGFRGADSNALTRLKKELQAEELPLTITYRCPKLVVREAQALCPDFTAAESAPEGTILDLTVDEMVRQIAPNDFLLSRVNAPLGGLWLQLVRAGIPARVEGKDLGKSILAMIRQVKAPTVADLLEKLHQTIEREALKLLKTKRSSVEARVAFLRDRLEMLEGLAEGLATPAELEARVQEMFGDPHRPCVVLSTIHRAKGLEANRVFLLMHTLYCGGKRKNQEEDNIFYVGLTRAKDTLARVIENPSPTLAEVGEVLQPKEAVTPASETP